jgi:hypothetical protein
MPKRLVVAGLVLALAVSGCTTSRKAVADRTAATPDRTAATPAAGPTRGAASRQTAAEADRTLASLRRLDDHPLYVMTYEGDYDERTGIAETPTPKPFGCSLFVAAGDPGRPLFGRNFDWDDHPALLLRTSPPDGYASISMVDISYLGVGPDPAGDRRLLDAPLLPFDGMNERGLTVGLAADDSGNLRPDPAKPTVGSVRILRLVLDHAATVAEALTLIGRYNLDFDGGPALHYLLADASGASAVVEFVAGRMRVVPGVRPWQALTNIRLADVDEAARRTDRRYGTVAATLTRAGGRLEWRGAMALLRDVAQPHTRWSVTYELTTGSVHLVAGQRWEQVYDFRLPMRR